MTRYLLAVGLTLTLGASVQAQVERYELGQRLRLYEAALDQRSDPESRRRALDSVQRATTLFFLNQMSEAARRLDFARLRLESPLEPNGRQLWAGSLTVRPERRLLDPADGKLPFRLLAIYPTLNMAPPGVKLQITLSRGLNKKAERTQSFAIGSLPLEGEVDLGGRFKVGPATIAAGDLHLDAAVFVGEERYALPRFEIALATDLDRRLRTLADGLAALPPTVSGTDVETLRSHLKLLNSLQCGDVFETDYPAARLLDEAEGALAALRAGRPYFGANRAGEFWLTLAVEGGTKPVRLLAPKPVELGRPLPLVVALHGARGSENLFFDGYGRGKIAELCRDRGWLLVAPRDGLTPDLIDAVDRLYPVDRRRVYLVGHSMGAAQATGTASRTPTRFAGVAALGGGGPIKPSDELKDVPFFVGVGAEDFLLAPAKRLRDSLTKADVRKVEFREYPDVEHLTIVQLALPDVFRFFDAAR